MIGKSHLRVVFVLLEALNVGYITNRSIFSSNLPLIESSSNMNIAG